MRARSITRVARSSMPQSQATATLPRVPSVRGTNFHPVPLQSVQFSRAMCSRRALETVWQSLFRQGTASAVPKRRQINKALAAEGLAFDFSRDRKSTRLNSSHANISYAVFCLKKKNILMRDYRDSRSNGNG